MTASTPQEVFQLKVSLRGIRPPVWRRLLVSAHTTLAQLHSAIQVAFGWEDYHLHVFTVHGEEYGPRDPDGEMDVKGEGIALAKLGLGAKAKFRYEYDFGDGWVHDLTVEKILVHEDSLLVPVCLGGKRACPPEDCGGAGGYEDMLEALEDPTNPRHEELAEWLDGEWDSEDFDLEVVNARLTARFAPVHARAPRKAKSRKP